MAYLHDPGGASMALVNLDTVVCVPVSQGHYMDLLKGLVERHLEDTGSRKAAAILQHWEDERGNFLQVVPKEVLDKLAVPAE